MNKNRERERRCRERLRDGASWYAYLCYRILRAQGCERIAALEKTFQRYPHALQYWKPCEPEV